MNQLPKFSDARLRFRDAGQWLQAMKATATEALLSAAGDIVLLLDKQGVIRDIAGAAESVAALKDRVGEPWSDTVTVESRPKIEAMVNGESVERWRQVTHVQDNGDFPVRYFSVPVGDGRTLAIGRDERAAAALQQRLLQVQQSLERDYLSMRQAEARYRLVFDASAEPMLVIEATSRRIREMNAAARSLLNAPANVSGHQIGAYLEEADRDGVIAFLGAAAAGARVSSIEIGLGAHRTKLYASAFRQAGVAYLLLRLSTGAPTGMREPEATQLLEKIPDAFVLVDAKLAIVTANSAFVDLAQANAAAGLVGRPLGEILGRPGIDLDLMLAQLAEHGVARNVATIARGLQGGQEEVEVSAVHAPESGHFGFSLRVIARRIRDLPPSSKDLPRSVEQLTELIGRMPLRDIVRESTDLIERQCIEAALTYTSNNRASAAEILGLSRQSLYSKLHRHGLVASDLVDD